MYTLTSQKAELSKRAPGVIRLALFIVFLCGFIATVLTLLTPSPSRAATSSTINFQARLETAGGAIAADGNYNIEFNLYNVSSAGSSEWHEDYLNNNSQGVHVANGYLTVNLGSITGFSGINWNQQQWLTMNVGNTNLTCTPFSSCVPDGEMSPRLLLTATPYAFQAGGLSSTNGSFTDSVVLSATPAANNTITIPDATGTVCLQTASACGFATGSGAAFLQGGNSFSATGELGTNDNNPLNFRTNNADRLQLTTSGNLIFQQSSTVNTASAGTALSLTLQGGAATTGTNVGGNLLLQGGAGASTGVSGSVIVKPAGLDTTAAFQVQNAAGTSSVFTVDSKNTAVVLGNDGTPSDFEVRGGAATGTNIQGSNITFDASNGTGAGGSGDLIFRTAPSVLPVTHDADSSDSGANVSSLTWSHTVGAGSNGLLVVGIGTTLGQTVSSVTYAGAALTKLKVINCATVCHEEFWYKVAPATGTNSIVVTLSASTVSAAAGASSYYNVNQTTPFGTAATSTGSSTSASITVSTVSAQLVVDTVVTRSGATLTPGGIQIQRWNVTDPANRVSASSTLTATGSSTAFSWTVGSSTNWGEIGVGVNPAGSTSTPDTLTDVLHLASSGNVGIGTANPQDTLSIASGNIYLGNGTGDVINMSGLPTSATAYNFYGSSTEAILNSPSSAGDIAFKIQNAEIARFDSSGDLGIGTPTPAEPLQVVSPSNHEIADFAGPSGVNDGYIVVDQGDGGGNALLGSTGGVGFVGSIQSTPFTIRTGNTERARFDTTGQLGLNTSSPDQQLTINGNGAIWNSDKIYLYDGNGTTQRGQVGGGRNGDMSVVSLESGKELRIGSASNIGFWMDNNANNTDSPGVLFANKGDTLNTGWNAANALTYFGKYTSTNRSINAAGSVNSNGADYAEYFYQQTSGGLATGDVATLSASGKVERGVPNDPIVGVVSTQAGFVGNDLFDANDPNATALVGLMGQIPTKVSTANGIIHTGDPLTLSASMPGVAVKQILPGPSIGHALEGYTNPNALGLILVLVQSGWTDPGTLQGYSSTVLESQMTDLSVKMGQLSSNAALLNQPNVFAGTSLSQLQIQNAQGDVLFTADTKNMVLTVSNLTVTGTLSLNGHVITNGDTPQITTGDAACSAANASVQGNDVAGVISLTVATPCKVGGELLKVTFSKKYDGLPRVSLTPASAASADLSAYIDDATVSESNFSINALSSKSVVPLTTYVWNYQIMQ